MKQYISHQTLMKRYFSHQTSRWNCTFLIRRPDDTVHFPSDVQMKRYFSHQMSWWKHTLLIKYPERKTEFCWSTRLPRSDRVSTSTPSYKETQHWEVWLRNKWTVDRCNKHIHTRRGRGRDRDETRKISGRSFEWICANYVNSYVIILRTISTCSQQCCVEVVYPSHLLQFTQHLVSIKSSQMQVTRTSHVCHMHITCMSHAHHMYVTCTGTCMSHAHHMYVTCTGTCMSHALAHVSLTKISLDHISLFSGHCSQLAEISLTHWSS